MAELCQALLSGGKVPWPDEPACGCQQWHVLAYHFVACTTPQASRIPALPAGWLVKSS